ncbi:MAG: IS1 family transposase, partial [Cyanobacteria bacterium P01_C01_bin.89]
RQRMSRLVRCALSFSKKVENHAGALRYFLNHYNLSLAL